MIFSIQMDSSKFGSKRFCVANYFPMAFTTKTLSFCWLSLQSTKNHILKFRYSSLWMYFDPNVIFVWFCNCDFLLSLKMNASLPGLCFSAWVVSEQKLWKGVRISSLSWPLIGQIISLISLIGLISYSDDPWWCVDIFVFTQHTSSH